MIEHVQVGPHEFSPIAWHDRLRSDGRCSACYFPKAAHPVKTVWSVARPFGDNSRLSFREALSKERDALHVIAAVAERKP